MTNKPSRTSTPIPTTPTTPPPSTTERSKLPKFLQSARRRGAGGGSGSSGGGAADDRGGVRTDPESRASVSSAGTSSAGSSRLSTVSAPAAPIQIPETPARGSRLVSSPFDAGGGRDDDSPVLVEPTPRTRRGDPAASLYTPSSANRLGELPTRLSGWFSNAFGGSASDLSLPALLTHAAASAPSGSPASPRARASPHALLVAAKHGKGQIDKAMRYLLDSDATPDNCPDPIWLLGVLHPSRAPSPALSPALSDAPRGSAEFRRAARAAARGSNESLATRDTLAHAASQLVPKHPGAHWPPAFYADFSTRIWCTYRSGFPPIRDSALSALEREIGSGVQDMLSTSPTSRRWWGGEKGWTNDTGWGCMLRTGQSLLANALLHMELGRDWRVPTYPEQTPEFAAYVRILTWFLDNPSVQCPFSVHRMALAGKELGKDVGQWFGPSTAAGAIKTLVNMFPAAGLGVAVASDGVVYQTDVYSASHGPLQPRRLWHSWGNRPVLVLIGLRLGLDGVNPIYYDTIKILYTFPQSVGIAGGRPSSSYYFVGAQAENLFYLDPHHARPTVPLRTPPAPGSPDVSSFDAGPALAREDDRKGTAKRRKSKRVPLSAPLSPTKSESAQSDASATTSGSPPGSAVSAPAGARPARMAHTASTSSAGSSASTSQIHMRAPASSHGLGHSRYATDFPSPGGSGGRPFTPRSPGPALTPEEQHYCSAYSVQELRTFHCERVRKMPLSGLDPSMLLGFLVRDENDWRDLRMRITDLARNHKPIFSIQDEPPVWPSDGDSIGLESFSDPDEVPAGDDDDDDDGDGELEDDEAGGDDELFEAARSRSPSTSPDPEPAPKRRLRVPVLVPTLSGGSGVSADTEFFDVEDDPRTPGPGSTFARGAGKIPAPTHEIEIEHDPIEDDWVDPSLPTPIHSPEASPSLQPATAELPGSSTTSLVSAKTSRSGASGGSGGRSGARRGSGSRRRAPEPAYPFPVAPDPDGPEDEDEDALARTLQPEKRLPQMRTATARDGGRTKSGGVRGVPLEDT